MSSKPPSPAPPGKHPVDATEAEEAAKRQKVANEDQRDENEDDPENSASTFRAWSKAANKDKGSTSTILTMKCMFGNPDTPLQSWIKTSKVDRIKEMLRDRKLSTDGSKAVLLERLQKDLPCVVIDIDSRECLQRLINAMLYHFKWDNTHLFTCKMPARGALKEGTGNLWKQSFGWDFYFNVKDGGVSSDPMDHNPRMRKHIQNKLDAAGLNWSDLDRVSSEPDAIGHVRSLEGAAFSHEMKNEFGDDDSDSGVADGGWFSLEELALQKSDKLQLTYDYGDGNKFSIQITDVKSNQPLLPEKNIYGHETRVALIEKSKSKIRKQYDHGTGW